MPGKLLISMKTILDTETRLELIGRINLLDETSCALWGKMNLYQMITHCSKWEEMLLGKTQYKQLLLGRLFGKMALKDMMKDEPVKHNMPTLSFLRITGDGDVTAAKAQWISLIREHDSREACGFVHPFFGLISARQAGIMGYKHADHHLRQFNR